MAVEQVVGVETRWMNPRVMVTEGQVYAITDPMVKQYPWMFRRQDTGELVAQRGVSVEQATAAPGETRTKPRSG
jgi:hypothetical protein